MSWRIDEIRNSSFFASSLRGLLSFLVVAFLVGKIDAAHAETDELRISYQTGFVYLPIMVMEHEKLVEKHAKAAGLNDLKVSYPRLSGAGPMNDALLGGGIDIAAGGVGGLITLWSKTHDRKNAIRGVSGFASANMYLNTRNPEVKSIHDFTVKDRIAVPAVKVSTQALVLQMAAAKTFGQANYAKLDNLTVSMPNPASAAALISGSGGITSNFTAPPFSNEELRHPEIRTVLTSYEVMGNGTILDVFWATSEFHDANPKTFAVFLAAAKDAISITNKDKKAAARIYVESSGSKMSVAQVLEILDAQIDGVPQMEYTADPKNITQWSSFMHKVGRISVRPNSWKELFFPEAHDLAGS